jgi:EmrB/QacA subfamily drug resistance transporter
MRSRRLALYLLCSGMLMIVLDISIVNVALPSIQHDLGFSPSGLAWVVNAYLIAFGGLLLLAGRIGDLFGRRRVFLAGLAAFTAASALCGFADSPALLVIARFVQGTGGALTSAVILGMIVTMFPEPREQAQAIGVYAFVASAGGAVGALAGGVLTQLVSWHWIFFVNVPIGMAGVALAARVLPADEPTTAQRGSTDVAGAVLITAALMLGVYTIVVPGADRGWSDGITLTSAALAVGLLAGFVAREASASAPLMPLRILRSRNVAGANVMQLVGAGGMFGAFFLGALYMQHVWHYGPLEIGLAFLPVSVLMGGLSVRYSERLVTRFGLGRVMLPGLVLIALGLVLLAVVPQRGSYVVHLLPAMVLLGTGAGLAFPPLMTLSMSGVAPADAGLASGLVNTTGQVGAAIGLAVLATTSATRTATLLGAGATPAAALTGGYHLAFWVAAGLLVAAVAVALVVVPLSRSTQERADETDTALVAA